MSQGSGNGNLLDPFATARAIRNANMEAWSKIMQQWVNTQAYTQSTNALLDAYLTTSAPVRKLIEQTMTQMLSQFNMPTRNDVISIAERLTNIETRLDDLDAQLDAMRRAQLNASRPLSSATEPDPVVEPAQRTSAETTATAQTMDSVVESISETGMREQPPKGRTTSRRKARTKEQH